ncbi:MAG: zinc ribbon domain-containing protein [Ruminococcaceae bacterium]|nr:zinc ribbon domain-containing protein [Oscillospiraceae bacterium]
MRICTSCGHNNSDTAAFCALCGNPLVAGPADNSDYTQQNDRINFDFSENNVFVSNDEYVVATLKNGIVNNILSGEGIKTEDAVLTNKRLYYNHKTGIINIHTQEEKVNIKDITGSKIATFNPVGLLILSILLFLVGFIGLFAKEEEVAVAFIPATLLLIVYFIVKKSHLKIEYAGGSIYFSVKKYGQKNIRNFQKCIYAVKDHLSER